MKNNEYKYLSLIQLSSEMDRWWVRFVEPFIAVTSKETKQLIDNAIRTRFKPACRVPFTWTLVLPHKHSNSKSLQLTAKHERLAWRSIDAHVTPLCSCRLVLKARSKDIRRRVSASNSRCDVTRVSERSDIETNGGRGLAHVFFIINMFNRWRPQILIPVLNVQWCLSASTMRNLNVKWYLGTRITWRIALALLYYGTSADFLLLSTGETVPWQTVEASRWWASSTWRIYQWGQSHNLCPEPLADDCFLVSRIPIIIFCRRPCLKEKGVTFQSPIDGKKMLLTPERSVHIQNRIGANVIMALDDVVSSVCLDSERFQEATCPTLRWIDRCIAAHQRPSNQALFGIIQGGIDLRLRSRCIKGKGFPNIPVPH